MRIIKKYNKLNNDKNQLLSVFTMEEFKKEFTTNKSGIDYIVAPEAVHWSLVGKINSRFTTVDCIYQLDVDSDLVNKERSK